MTIPLLESRVTRLEDLMADLIVTVDNTSRQVDRLSREMTEFKAEMKDFKDEMRVFKAESEQWRSKSDENLQAFRRDSAENLQAFRRDSDENLQAFRRDSDEKLEAFRRDSAENLQAFRRDSAEKLEAFRQEMREENRKLNKQLGEIANKQGRMVEDMVEPSMDRIFKELLQLPPDVDPTGGMRIKRPHPLTGQVKEFDVIRTFGDYVLVNETKSTLRPEDVDRVLGTVHEVREYFPEFRDKKLIASLAALNVDHSLLTYASRNGVVVLAVGDDLMDIVNPSGFRFTEF